MARSGDCYEQVLLCRQWYRFARWRSISDSRWQCQWRRHSKRITDCFEASFFNTNFWFEWCSLFAFERWHSAIEFKRYLLRFIHHFSTIDTQEGIFRTRYNQYDSMAVPLVSWLRGKGVDFRMQTQVTNLGFKAAGSDITVNSLQYNTAGTEGEIPVGRGDLVFVTNGSMTADKTFGSMTKAPVMDRSKQSGAWRLWETIAAGRPELVTRRYSTAISRSPRGSHLRSRCMTQHSSN